MYFVLVRIVSVCFGVPGFVGDTCLSEVADGAGGCLWWWADLRVWGARTRWGVQIGIAKLPRIANLPKETQKKFLVFASFEVSKDIWRSRKNIGTWKNNCKEVFTWRLWTALARQIWNVWSFLHSLKSCTVNKKVGWFGRFGTLLLCPVLLKGSGQLFKNGGHPKANLSNVKFHCWKRRFLLETINFRFLRFLQPTFYLKFGVYWFLKVVIRHVIGGHVAAARLATGKIFKAEFLFLAALYNRDSQTPWVCKLPNISQLGLGMPRGLGYLHPPKINMTGWKIPAWMSRGSMYFLLKMGGGGFCRCSSCWVEKQGLNSFWIFFVSIWMFPKIVGFTPQIIPFL